MVDSGDVLEKENGERRLESRFAGEYIEGLHVSFSFSSSSSAAGVFIGVANEAVSLSDVSMLILIYQTKNQYKQMELYRD